MNQTSLYAGVTLATPIQALKVGGAVDYLKHRNSVDDEGDGSVWVFGGYASFQATEKLSLNVRGEYVNAQSDALEGAPAVENQWLSINHLWEGTVTAQYDLWKNVISRLELRWDHSLSGQKVWGPDNTGVPSENPGSLYNEFMLAANIIYKF